MSREKQIEEMANDIDDACGNRGCPKDRDCSKCRAEWLYELGYRKQSEGEWIKQKPDPEAMRIFHEKGLGNGMSLNSIYWTCSVCDNWGIPHHKYCSSCGAKMKGGAK